MSPLERPVPPSGEQIHIPGPSLHPVLLAAGVALALVGVTGSKVFLVVGVVLTIGVLVQWIRGARAEYDELPAEHHPAVQETVPRASERPHGAEDREAAA